MQCEVADKNSPKSSNQMSSHDSSKISGGGFFQIPGGLLYIIDFQMSCFYFCWIQINFQRHITGNDDSDEVPNQNRAKITGNQL